jgi:peroxiredoxin
MKSVSCLIVLGLLMLTGAAPLMAEDSADYAQEGERRAVAAGAVVIGQRLPALTLKTIDGASIDLGAYRGKRPVYLKFWATWCAPCLAQMPDFNAIHARLGGDIEVIALNTGFNDDLAAVQRFREELNMRMPVVIDDGRLARALNLRVTPQHVVVGRDGRILHVGHLDDAKLHAALEQAIAQSVAGGAGEVPELPVAKTFKPGDDVRDVELRTLDGMRLRLGSARSGKPRGVVFTAAWCEWYVADRRPETAQACERVRQRVDALAARGEVLWVTVASDLWTSADDLREYGVSNQLRTPLVLYEGGALFAAFGVRKVPSVALIGMDGRLQQLLGPEEFGVEAVKQLGTAPH